MENNELRKVSFEDWRSHGKKETEGVFHRWANVYDENIEGIVAVAIIEESGTGKVLHVRPEFITFKEN